MICRSMHHRRDFFLGVIGVCLGSIASGGQAAGNAPITGQLLLEKGAAVPIGAPLFVVARR